MYTTTVNVNGMTCENCVRHVSEELRTIDGVTEIAVALHAGGVSPVTITATGEIDPDAIAEAVEEAGYALVD